MTTLMRASTSVRRSQVCGVTGADRIKTPASCPRRQSACTSARLRRSARALLSGAPNGPPPGRHFSGLLAPIAWASEGHLTLAVFLVLQAADGLITYSAVSLIGTSAEGNLLISTWMDLVGAGPALLGAKLVACGGGVVLYTCGVHRVLTGLTALYAFGAVGPWLCVLSTPPFA
jgi:hypothetical protein